MAQAGDGLGALLHHQPTGVESRSTGPVDLFTPPQPHSRTGVPFGEVSSLQLHTGKRSP